MLLYVIFMFIFIYWDNSKDHSKKSKVLVFKTLINATVIGGLEKNGVVVVSWVIPNSNDFFDLFIFRQIDPMIWKRRAVSGEMKYRSAAVERWPISDTLKK